MSWHLLQLNYEEFVKNNKSIAETIIDKYIVYEKIGSGAFGSVYRGMNDQTKKQVAIKVLDLVAIDREESSPKVKEIRRRLAKTESELMSKVNSQHVMKLYDVYQNKWLKIMVIEFCNGGTLSDEIMKRGRIPQKQAIQIIKQIILGISQMHKLNIIHRDLKTDNIMSHNGIYKIVDLGFAKLLPSDSDIQNTVLGTIITMAPEVMRREKYGLKADIWSIGVIFYQMVYGRLPYQPMKSADMYEQIIKKNIFPNDGKVNGYRPSEQVLILLKKILVVNHHNRVNWKQLVNQDLFRVKPVLPDQFRITVNIDHLNKVDNTTTKERNDLDVIKQIEDKKSLHLADHNPVKIEPLSYQDKKKKREQVDKSDQNVLQWARAKHLECLKTQLIFNEILLPIQNQQMLNLKDRKVVQLLYLLSSRCYFNMSFVLNQFEDSNNPIVVNLKKTVQNLYKQVHAKFQQYCKQLQSQQNKIGSIIGDRFSKIFKSQSIKTKDKFLVGFENVQYKKQEQIMFTYEYYIQELIGQLKNKFIQVKSKLNHYVQINRIQIKDLKDKNFQKKVEEILSKGVAI